MDSREWGAAPTVHVFADAAALVEAAARLFVTIAATAVAQHGRFLTALSGGSTPQALFQRLSQPDYAQRAFWRSSHIFWGDERLVPPDDPGSNYKLAADLLLQHVPVPAANIHRAKGELDPETAVTDYAHQLHQLAPAGHAWPRLDLALMGLGSDGHTASLFPGPIAPGERTHPVIAVTANYDGRPAHRLTLTPLVFNDASHILFLVTGANKAQAVTAVLHGPPAAEQWPAQRIHPTTGQITWLLDQSAAAPQPKTS
ncbi:MAG: 6-phosphogluconolactonase [Chloroflexi bacterium]|nr:6-phosphogluconolactonase [Chloroflexota bacterium]